MKKYLGGYFLIKPLKFNYKGFKDKYILTCSSCVNEPMYDSWALSWTIPNESQSDRLRKELFIDKTAQSNIQNWADQKFEEKKIGWSTVFSDYDTGREYYHLFFSHIENAELIKLVFPEDEALSFLREFQPENKTQGASGIYEILDRKTEIRELSPDEEFIGYDLIGVEYGGANFHTFHCHGLSEELNRKFQLELNEYGLIEQVDNPKGLVDFMNDDENGFEPVPWFLVEVIRVNKSN